MNGDPDGNALFVRALLLSAKEDGPRVGARTRCIARVSAAPAAMDFRRVGSVLLAAALAAALGLGCRWTPAPAGPVPFTASCAAGGEAQTGCCSSDARGGADTGGFMASSGSSGGSWSGSSG